MFSINREEPYDILAVGDWSQKLSFYQLSGKQVLVNPLTPKISLVILLTVCHSVLVELPVHVVWRICY